MVRYGERLERWIGAFRAAGGKEREDYARDVQLASLFLLGKHQEVIGRLSDAMDRAANELAFEQAALYRDQIRALRQVQDKQYVESGKGEDVDVVTVVAEDGILCVNLAMVRGGRHLGDKPQFPTNAGGSSPPEVLAAFLYQHYLSHPIPMRIYVNLNVSDTEVASTLEISEGAVKFHLNRGRDRLRGVFDARQEADQ